MLVNVPLRDQLAEPTTDHQPDENASANCVPASLSAAFTALVGRAYYGDELKDAVYGQTYTGATDPERFVAYAAQQGIHMWEVDSGAGDVLVATIHQELEQGHPVAGAIPSMWGNTTAADIAAHGGPTHEVMFCDAGSGWLTAMNPWPVDGHNAFYQTMPDAWWASRLVYRHVHPLERTAKVTLTKLPDGSARDEQGHELHFGMAAEALAHDAGANILLEETYAYGDGATYDSFAALDDGAILTYRKAENAVRRDRGGQVVAHLVALVQAAQSQPQQPPETPQDKAARLAIAALKLAMQ